MLLLNVGIYKLCCYELCVFKSRVLLFFGYISKWRIAESYSSLYLFFVFWFLIFQDSFSLCSPDCPGTYSVDQAGLERRNLSASAYKVVGRTKGMFHHCPAVYYFSMPDESILVHFRVGLLVDFMLFFWRCGGLPPTQAQAWEINK